MGDSSWVQDSFLGGEWSPLAQGRITHPKYKTAMNKSLNGYPLASGAWTRRPGFQLCGPTRHGQAGRVIQFNFTDLAPYRIELSDSFARIFKGIGLCFTNDITTITNISTASPAVMTLAAPVTWSTGDGCVVLLTNVSDASALHLLHDRQLILTKIDTSNFSLSDAISGAPVDGSQLNWSAATVMAQAAHILELAMPYTGMQWQSVRAVAAANATPAGAAEAMLLHGSYKPQIITTTTTGGAPGTNTQGFTTTPQDFLDGPYYDPPKSGGTVAISAASGTVTATVDNATDVGPNGFVVTDVGRQMRLYSEPPLWDAATTYSAKALVKWPAGPNGAYFIAVGDTATGTPTSYLPSWSPVAPSQAAAWVWGIIRAVNNSTTVMLEIQKNTDGTDSYGFPFYSATHVQVWRMGVFSNTTGWPTCGCYHEGRFWFSGAVGNRVDSSNSNDLFNMSPTAPDGTVGASNGITYTFDADNTNTIYFLEPNSYGIVAGSKNGEWLISAPTPGSIAPANIKAVRATKVGCANILPAATPLTAIIVHKYQRTLVEYFPEVFSGKLTAPDLNAFAKHLTVPYIREIGYQSETIPLVWMRLADGSLAAATYQRRGAYGSEDPAFAGFHRHSVGDDHTVESLTVGPSTDGTLDTVYQIEFDPSRNLRHLVAARPIPDEGATLLNGWYLDDGIVPYGAKADANGLTLYGLYNNEGEGISAQIGGLDCGDYTITNGKIVVPWGSDPGKKLTLAYLQSISATTYGDMAVTIDGSSTTVPIVTGFTYTSQGQTIRPQSAEAVGTRNGPGFAKTRRNHMFGALIGLAVSDTVKIGPDFIDPGRWPMHFEQPNGVAIPTTETFAGMFWDTLEDDYDFEGMIAWEVSRPVPLIIASVGAFQHGQDR